MSQTEVAVKNRRVSRRRSVKATTKLTCYKGSLGLGRSLAVAILDLSETGIRLVVKTALDVGQELEINLLSQHHSSPTKLLANVMWCVEAVDGTFCIGAQFQRRARLQRLA